MNATVTSARMTLLDICIVSSVSQALSVGFIFDNVEYNTVERMYSRTLFDFVSFRGSKLFFSTFAVVFTSAYSTHGFVGLAGGLLYQRNMFVLQLGRVMPYVVKYFYLLHLSQLR